ncbi:zf-CCHC domain-containing protein [Tanacetum coccineum]
MVSNDDTAMAQRRLEDKQPEEKTNTDCLVKERENVHLGIKVGENITVTGVPGQEGAKGGPRFEVPALDEDDEYRLCLSVTPKGIFISVQEFQAYQEFLTLPNNYNSTTLLMNWKSKVKNKGVPDLTMVDFRGITRVPVHGQPEDIYEQISAIITEYITPEESIILNVLSTSVDFSTCESIRMSQRVDVTGQRTLAVARKQTKIMKDSEIVKAKVKRKSLALNAKKESSDEECSTSGSEDEEYVMGVRDFKKFFKRRDPNHLIGECLKPPRDKNQRAFVGGSWSDSGEENDEKIQDETCLVAQAPNEVCPEFSYFNDENSSIDDLALDNEYDKLCKMSLKIITKNKKLKATRNSLENELRELKNKLSTLEKNKGVDLNCAKCHTLKIENEKLKVESTRLNKFGKSTHCLNEMLCKQKPSGDKLGLGFNSFEASSSGTKEIKFVKA